MTSQQASLLRVSVVRTGKTAVLRLDGELDCATAPQVDAVVDDLLAAPDRLSRVLVDAERLSFVDVSGLAPLIRARRLLSTETSLQLRNARRQVARVVRLLDLADYLGLEP